jgi:transcriptional regulator with XRE-family HTH domain
MEDLRGFMDANYDRMSIHKRIKFFMGVRRITGEEIAKKMGISRSAISRIVNGVGEIEVPRLKAIAEILKVDIKTLLN